MLGTLGTIGLVLYMFVSVQFCTFVPVVEAQFQQFANQFSPSGNGNMESISTSNPTPFNATSPTVLELKKYNNFSAAIYCQDQMKDLSCSLCDNIKKGIVSYKIFENRHLDVMAMVTVHKDSEEIVATYKGSSSGVNFAMDFTIAMTSMPQVPQAFQVHVGMWASFNSIREEVIKEIVAQSTLHPTYKLVVTGHSLGGSMASFLVFTLNFFKQLPTVPMSLITYGMPRIGNKAYVQYMNGLQIPMARVVNRGDPVPHIVRADAKTNDLFFHHLREYFIDDKGNERYCRTDVYEDPTCSNVYMKNKGVNPMDHESYFGANYLSCVGPIVKL